MSIDSSSRTSTTLIVAVVSTAAIGAFTLWIWSPRSLSKTKNTNPNNTTTSNAEPRRRRHAICPYSSETNFIVIESDTTPPTPLDLFESWTDPTSPDFGRPLAARWLCAGISGQDSPGILRAGLKRLPNSKYFLLEEPFHMKQELLQKHRALDDPIQREQCLVAEPDSLAAQEETLELFLSYLPRRYPDLYIYDEQAGTLYVTILDQEFVIDEWVKAGRALELVERIVQEDLVLLRPPRPTDTHGQFAMAAAAVVFSFDGLPEKLGQPVSFIHAPVPGYEQYLQNTMNLTFEKLLKVESPMWRNNWAIAPGPDLQSAPFGLDEVEAKQRMQTPTKEEIQGMWLQVEYQTIRRLPQSGYILFTIRTLADPMKSLESVPQAASCLATSLRGMSKPIRKYKGIHDDETCAGVLSYLDSITLLANAN
eukprot:Nitzschia sp. Nitz4//scaffold11_size288233//250863//252131//NITZ4_000817-RA/size288233-processed-gene-0.188-mRNA-1//1//CDS//3329534203//1684//frame0